MTPSAKKEKTVVDDAHIGLKQNVDIVMDAARMSNNQCRADDPSAKKQKKE